MKLPTIFKQYKNCFGNYNINNNIKSFKEETQHLGQSIKNEQTKICGRLPLKNLKWYGLPRETMLWYDLPRETMSHQIF